MSLSRSVLSVWNAGNGRPLTIEQERSLAEHIQTYLVTPRKDGQIEQLARDLLSRLSRDYGDDEGELDSDVASLFERGERLFPIAIADPTFVCEGCGKDTHMRLNGLCLECANRNRNE